ncbi:MAG TPA: hypothetical protein VEC99_02550 [Clostridia bacterium]|nr:hypothetical protein [Clostridia bacterium]
MKNLLMAGCLLLAAQTIYAETKAPAPQPGTQASDATGGFSGKVVETMNSGGYTYVRVDTGSKKVWAAAPQFSVKVGDSASFAEGMPMRNYHSKTLKRDFDVVYFTPAVSVNGVPAGGAGAKMTELPKGHPPIGGMAAAPPKVDLSGIKKAQGGHTVAEIYADPAKLSGRETKVRGKVVKYNPMIMGRNWIHLRDGTGKDGSNDLLVTSNTDVKVGDTVVATGKVATNKDFGAGYKYGVMMEDAKIAVE